MKKTLLALVTAATIIAVGTSSINTTKSVYTNSGASIATQTSCTGCHSSGTGTITIDSLPKTVVAGKSYPISITISQATQAMKWGFTAHTSTGTFSTTNTNVGLSGTTGIYHKKGAASTGTKYTFTNITWTAPKTAGTVTLKLAAMAGTNASGSSGHTFTSTVTTTVSLPTPITLASFDASATASKVALKWTTSNEVNGAYFQVERSVDGVNFVAVGKIAAVGNAASTQSYNYTDDAKGLTGTVSYRLQSFDKDGASTYSDVKTVSLSTNSFALSVYPNPIKVGADLKIKFNSSKNDHLNLNLLNASGKTVSSTYVAVAEGNNNLSFKIGNLSAGIYYMAVLKNNTIIERVPVMIQK